MCNIKCISTTTDTSRWITVAHKIQNDYSFYLSPSSAAEAYSWFICVFVFVYFVCCLFVVEFVCCASCAMLSRYQKIKRQIISTQVYKLSTSLPSPAVRVRWFNELLGFYIVISTVSIVNGFLVMPELQQKHKVVVHPKQICFNNCKTKQNSKMGLIFA